MSYNTTEPTNKNFLSPLGFKFSIKKTPNVNYFVQSVNLPSMALGTTTMPTPFIRVPIAGDHITYGDLTVTFKLDESLSNYLELHNWIKQIGFPDAYSQYSDVNLYSDATLTILSSAYNPKFDVKFKDLFPIDLSGFEFNMVAGDVDYIEATVTFGFRTFDIVPL